MLWNISSIIFETEISYRASQRAYTSTLFREQIRDSIPFHPENTFFIWNQPETKQSL